MGQISAKYLSHSDVREESCSLVLDSDLTGRVVSGALHGVGFRRVTIGERFPVPSPPL